MTDFERADALDHLSSDELEAQAFGPDPDAKRSLRALVDRPTRGAVSVRVKDKKRRWPKVVLAAAAVLAVLVAGVAIGVDLERQPDAVVSPLSDAEVEAIEGALRTGADPLEAQAEALEAEIDAMQDVDGGVLSDGPAPGDAVVAD